MATLTQAYLNKVFKGISKISIVPASTAMSATVFDDADELFTVKNSVSFSQAQPSKTEILVDQRTAPIAATYEPGEFTITASIPSVAKEVLEYFFTKNESETPYENLTGFSKQTAIDLNMKVIDARLQIVNDSGTMAIVIPMSEIIGNLDWSDTSSSALSTAITITPKVNSEGKGDILVFEK